jgi:YegS/Rv2252/BmrU family lipid kinase
MSQKHIVFIVNPKSGTERQKEIGNAVATHLDRSLYTHQILITKHAGHGAELARAAAANGAHAVVAVGGDGSVNEIARGLEGTGCNLGIIPKGSGNGISRTLGIPLGLADAIKVINRGNTTTIDIGYANDRLFVSNAGIAFDALIAQKFATSHKRGFLVYSWLVAKHLWTYKSRDYTIIADGKELHERAFMVNVANGKYFGYTFRIAPMAECNDGKLELIVVSSFPKILGGLIAMRAMLGDITTSRYVSHHTCNTITISHPELTSMQVDGDAIPCANSITFQVKPLAQRILVP